MLNQGRKSIHFDSFKHRSLSRLVLSFLQNGPSKICGRQPLKNLKGFGLLQVDHTPLNFVKGCLPQMLLGPYLNTLSHMILTDSKQLSSYELEHTASMVQKAWILL